MNPYYQERNITIYHGDSREILPNLRGDLILTDFPYAINEDYDTYKDTEENLQVLIKELIPLMLITAPLTALSCGVGNMFKYPSPSWVLSWVTTAGAGSGPWGFCCWQPILVYGKDPYLQNSLGRRPDTYFCTEISVENGHPCPKPLGVWKWFLQRVSCKDTDVVIDPLCGSGTTLVAAKQLGKKAIGIDMSKEYLDIAIDRLRQDVLQFESQESVQEGELLF